MDGPKSFGQALHQAGELLRGLTPSQRAWLAGGAVVLGITLWLFAGLIDKPKYATLYSGLKPADAQALGGRLAAKNISYEISPDGTNLSVPADQLDASRLETASQGLPRNARLGFELFDAPNWAGSDFTEKVNYQRALEGELERTLQTLSEVEAVRVHLVLPSESLYSEQASEAKAAVILKTRGGRLSEQAQLAIPQLVASAVDRLRPENVTVVDADSNMPLLHARGPGEPASYDLDEELAKTLVRTLEPVVGAEHVRASVHVEYDTSTSENTEELYDPKISATLSQQKSVENMGGGGPAGVPGTTSNIPGAAVPVTATTAPETQSSTSESSTFAVSKSVRHTMQPPGRIKRIAAAVLVDDAADVTEKDGKRTTIHRKRTTDELKQIEQLAGAAIGLETSRGDMLTVQNLSFQEQPQAEAPMTPTKLDKTRELVMQWSGLLRYLGIAALFLIVYFLILRPVKKQVLLTFRELPTRVATKAKEFSRPAPAPEIEIELPEGTEQSKRTTALKKQLTEKVKGEPAAASRVVQSWIREGSKE